MELFKSLQLRVQTIDDDVTSRALIDSVVRSGPHDAPVHVTELDSVVQRYAEWLQLMPRVSPYYAIKSNDDESLVELVTLLGAGYDCASQSEMERVVAMGVPAKRIIYAQPSKTVESLNFARLHRIRTVFDHEGELRKIAQHYPDAELLIRYRFDSKAAKTNLGTKFGCSVGEEARELLDLAKELHLNVVGWCFNIGSMCYDCEIFYEAIRAGRTITDYAQSIGFNFRFIDIGGGFVGDKDSQLSDYAKFVNCALEEFFPDPDIEVIAEPGRFLCATAVTNICYVVSKRIMRNPIDRAVVDVIGYYLNDGMYGTFYSSKYRNMPAVPILWKARADWGPPRRSKLFGPTCDGNDCFLQDVDLPEMDVGDTLVFETQGAYSRVHSCRFNGFPLPKTLPFLRPAVWKLLERVALGGTNAAEILLKSDYIARGATWEMLKFD